MDFTFGVLRPGIIASAGHSAAKRVGINSAWLLLARIIVQVQTLLLTVLVARRLGEAAFGQYSFIASLIFLGNVLSTFGTDTLLIRQVARSRKTDIPEVSAVLGLQLLFSTIIVASVWLWRFPGYTPEFTSALRLYSLSLFPLAFYSVYSAILRGMERMDLALLASFGTALAQILVVVLTVLISSHLDILMGALLAVQVFAMVFSYWLCRAVAPALTIHWKVEKQLLARLLRIAWPLAVLSILGVFYQRLGVFALTFSGSDAQTGLYSAASRVVEALKLGHIAVLGALLPALVRLRENSERKAEANRLFRNAAGGLLVLGLAGSVFATIFAAPLVNLLFGIRYTPAVPALQVLAWILVPYSLSSVLTVKMVSEKKEKYVTLILALSLVACACLSVWWIPLWGLRGACLAALVAETIQASLLFGWRNGI
ncbi:MAG: flippase [Omnitrophica WOR_2 bacterium]